MKLILFIMLMALSSCGDDGIYYYKAQESCTVAQVETGAIITCGSDVAFVENGKDAVDIKIIDPCGDDPDHIDELLFSFDERIVGWFKNTGMVDLTEFKYGVILRTTDHQKCKFMITDDGELEEL